ncbi:MAG TPA: cytochrome c3 family protein [Myxococcota bacterium]|nr:cytochrome c3 family protein [Myxococcota bacterium]
MVRLFNAALLLSFLCFAFSANAQPNCIDCHDDIKEEAFLKSAHGGGDADNLYKACRACHGNFEVDDDGHEAPDAVNCGACHQDSIKLLQGSIHHPPVKGQSGGVACLDCHGNAHELKKSLGDPKDHLATNAMCAQCHDDAMDEYLAGRHGKSKSPTVAACIDCHGSHDILDDADPRSRVFRLNQSETCAACHMDEQRTDLPVGSQKKVADYFMSVHGLAVSKSGLLVSATCVDCHGSHHVFGPDDEDSPLARVNIPALCGKCHAGVEKLYRESVHGAILEKGNDDVPVCTDCHESHAIRSKWDPKSGSYATNVPELCLNCHADQAMIVRNGMTEMRAETYNRSYHGAASRLGDKTVANCTSCHEAHDIRRSDDPKAATHAANLHETCAKCHKSDDPSSWMTIGKIHQSTAQESHWVTGLVQNIYWVLIAGSLSFFVGFIILDIRRTIRSRSK